MQTYVRFGALMLGAMLLTACGLGKENTTEIFNAKYYLYAVDHEGNLNIIGDNGAGKTKALKTIAFKNAKNQALNLGEVQFHQDYAYVVISNGLDQDAAGQDTEDHGGVLVVNMDDYTIVNTVHLRTQLKDKNNAPVPTRIVHTFADPDGTHLWLNNDGYSAPKDAATQDQRDLAALKDSVFRLNWDNEGGTEYLLVDEIRDGIGNGHKKSALSFSTTALPTTPKLFATHNLSDQTVSIVNNDATSVDFLKAATPIALNSDPSVKQNTPHGLTFSPLSGRFYVGITSGVDKGLAIIDAATRTLSSLPAGPADEMKIPAGGYVHANADGSKLYMIGYKANAYTAPALPLNRGYLSIIDVTASTDSVAQVIDLGDVAPSSFNFAHYEVNGVHGAKVLIGGTSGGGEKNTLKIIALDHETGLAQDPTKLITLTIGAGQTHRNGVVSDDGLRAYFPNGGDCGATHEDHGADCMSIAIIDTVNDTLIGKTYTAGHMPGALNVMQMSASGEHQH